MEFDLRAPERATVFVMQGKSGNLSPDRMVVWEPGKTVPTLIFGNADVTTPGSTVAERAGDEGPSERRSYRSLTD